MQIIETLLESPLVYSAWQAPFVRQKIAPFLEKYASFKPDDVVIDIGCGPGTNASLFSDIRYVGIDINPAYIEFAKRRKQNDDQTFLCCDSANITQFLDTKVSIIFTNSLFHHLTNSQAQATLHSASNLLSKDGMFHFIDVYQTEKYSLGNTLLRLDRGKNARTSKENIELVKQHFKISSFKEYPIKIAGIELWHVLYVTAEKI